MRRFRPGLCSVTFRQLAPDAVVALAAETGLSGIEWGGDVHAPPGDARRLREIGRHTREAGLVVSSYGTYLAPPDAGLSDLERALDAADALGTTHLRVWPGSRGKPSLAYAPAERDAALDALAAMAERAGERGATLGLEYHPNSLTDRLDSAADLAGRLRSDSLFLYWQPAPGLPRDRALAEIAALGGDICHLHVFAWDEASRRHPLEAQRADWTAWLATLPDSRWRGPAFAMLEFVENDDPDALRRDAAVLRSLLDAA